MVELGDQLWEAVFGNFDLLLLSLSFVFTVVLIDFVSKLLTILQEKLDPLVILIDLNIMLPYVDFMCKK